MILFIGVNKTIAGSAFAPPEIIINSFLLSVEMNNENIIPSKIRVVMISFFDLDFKNKIIKNKKRNIENMAGFESNKLFFAEIAVSTKIRLEILSIIKDIGMVK